MIQTQVKSPSFFRKCSLSEELDPLKGSEESKPRIVRQSKCKLKTKHTRVNMNQQNRTFLNFKVDTTTSPNPLQ